MSLLYKGNVKSSANYSFCWPRLVVFPQQQGVWGLGVSLYTTNLLVVIGVLNVAVIWTKECPCAATDEQ